MGQKPAMVVVCPDPANPGRKGVLRLSVGALSFAALVASLSAADPPPSSTPQEDVAKPAYTNGIVQTTDLTEIPLEKFYEH